MMPPRRSSSISQHSANSAFGLTVALITYLDQVEDNKLQIARLTADTAALNAQVQEMNLGVANLNAQSALLDAIARLTDTQQRLAEALEEANR